MPDLVRPEEKTFRELTQSTSRLTVPFLQRNYVWQTIHFSKLLEDIEAHIEGDRRKHFTGSIITADTDTEDDHLQLIDGQQRLTILCMLCRILYDIEDIGDDEFRKKLRSVYHHSPTDKHRIKHSNSSDFTDFSNILGKHSEWEQKKAELVEIGDDLETAVSEVEGKLSNLEELDAQIQENPQDQNKNSEFLQSLANLRESISKLEEVFEKYQTAKDATLIQWSNGKDGEKGFTNFFKQSYETLLKWVKGKEPRKLKEIIDFTLENVRIAVITIENKKQVHLIFRSINALGALLTDDEKIKNDLFARAVLADNFSAVEETWGQMVTVLSPLLSKNRKELGTFLWFYCRSKGINSSLGGTGRKLSQSQVYTVFSEPGGLYDRECCEPAEEGSFPVLNADKLLAFITELKHYSTAYMSIKSPEKLKTAPHNIDQEWIHEIVDIQSIMPKQSTPFFMAAYMRTIHHGHMKKRDFQKILKLLSTATARLVLSGKMRPNDLEFELADWISKLVDGPSVDSSVQQIKKDVCWLIHQKYELGGQTKEDFIANFQTIYDQAWKNQADQKFYEMLTKAVLKTKTDGPDTPRAKYLVRGCEGVKPWSTVGAKAQLTQQYYTTKFYTVEHILPKGQKTSWTKQSGPWWQEFQQHGDWPGTSEEISKVRYKLGNHILIENNLNSKCRSKTWSGSGNHVLNMNTPPPLNQSGKNTAWGKFHIYSHGEWSSTSDIVHAGSHLQCIKKFCQKYRREQYWTQTLLDERTKELATLAKNRTHWKFWK